MEQEPAPPSRTRATCSQRGGWVRRNAVPAGLFVLVLIGLVATSLGSRALARFSDTGPVAGNSLATDTLDPPTSLMAAAATGTVTLDWAATIDAYAAGHRILRAIASGGPYTQIAEIAPRTTVTYDDSPADGTYYYVARAYIQNWESVESNEVNATVGGITLDGGGGPTSATGSGSTLSWSHTVEAAGIDRIIIVGVSHETRESITGVTYAGQALTLIGGKNDPDDASRVELWYRLAPSTGANTVEVTFSDNNVDAVAGATSWTGVEQTAPSGFVSASGENTTPTVSVSSAAGEVVVDAVSNIDDGGAQTEGAGQTQHWSTTHGDTGGGGSHEPGAGTVTMSWTQGNDFWAIGAIPLQSA